MIIFTFLHTCMVSYYFINIELLKTETVQQSHPIYVTMRHPLDSNSRLQHMLKLQEVEDAFIENFHKTMTAIPVFLLPDIIEYIQMQVASLIIPEQRTPANNQTVKEEFEHIQTVSQLFIALKKYVSWFNYDFIVKLVRKFLPNNHQLKRAWSTYTDKLNSYFISGGLIKGFVDGSEVLVAILERDDYTIRDLRLFYRAIPQALKDSNTQLYFSTISGISGTTVISTTAENRVIQNSKATKEVK